MKILITGANGYIGQAVSTRLQIAGHDVHGLVRSEPAAAGLRARGITPVLGELSDSAVIRSAASEADAVVDTASADHADATNAFLRSLKDTGKTYVRTSGTGVYTDLAHGTPNDAVYREDDEFTPAEVVATRYSTDLAVQRAARSNVRTIVIRPSMIYGDGASEQLPLLIRQAITSRRSLYVGEGSNVWSNVYLPDLAELYLLALDKSAPGSVYNVGAGEEQMRNIATSIAGLVGLEAAESCPPEIAYAAFGQRWVDVALSSNSRVDSTKARRELGWSPQGPSLIDDLTRGSYRRLWAHKGDPHDHASH